MDGAISSILERTMDGIPLEFTWVILSMFLICRVITFFLKKLKLISIDEEYIVTSKYKYIFFSTEDFVFILIYIFLIALLAISLYAVQMFISENIMIRSLENIIVKNFYRNLMLGCMIIPFLLCLLFVSFTFLTQKKLRVTVIKNFSLIFIVMIILSSTLWNTIGVYLIELNHNRIYQLAINEYNYELPNMSNKKSYEEDSINSKLEFFKEIKANLYKEEQFKKNIKSNYDKAINNTEIFREKDSEKIYEFFEKNEELIYKQNEKLAKSELKAESKIKTIESILKIYEAYQMYSNQTNLNEKKKCRIKFENLLKNNKKFFDKNLKEEIKEDRSMAIFLMHEFGEKDSFIFSNGFIQFNLVYFSLYCLYFNIFLFYERKSMLINCKDNKRYRAIDGVISIGNMLQFDDEHEMIHKINKDDIERFKKVIFLEVADLNQSLNFYKDVFGIQNEISYTDSNGRPYICFHLFNKLFEIYESNNSNKDILKKVLEKHDIKCKIYQFDDQQNQINLRQIILSYNSQGWHGNDPQIKKLKKVKIEDPDGYTYILKNKK